MSHKPTSLFDAYIIVPAIGETFKKLDPRLMVKNPVMFVTLVGAVLTTVSIFTAKADHGSLHVPERYGRADPRPGIG